MNTNDNFTSAQSGPETFSDRAIKIISAYIKSTGSRVLLLDSNNQRINFTGAGKIESGSMGDKPDIEETICVDCTGNNSRENPVCRQMHKNAINESSCRGKPVIYRCSLGFAFWTVPVYSGSRFSCALRGSGFLQEDLSLAAIRFEDFCCNSIQPEIFIDRIRKIQLTGRERIDSLAEMLLLCAESLSCGVKYKSNKSFHNILRQRFEQQTSIASIIAELKEKYPEAGKNESAEPVNAGKDNTGKSSFPDYPLEKERLLIAAVRSGNKADAKKILNEILAVLIFCSQNQFRQIQLRAVELAVLLARAGTNSGNGMAANSITYCIKQIQEVKTEEELTGILHNLAERIITKIHSYQGIPHVSALQKADSYIRNNIGKKMSLNEIAKVAGLSSPYFSSVFKNEMGENLSRYINRLRVEKAGQMLLETNFSLSEISGECCFEDQSWFSKIFKSYTGMSPGKYRSLKNGKIYTDNNEECPDPLPKCQPVSHYKKTENYR